MSFANILQNFSGYELWVECPDRQYPKFSSLFPKSGKILAPTIPLLDHVLEEVCGDAYLLEIFAASVYQYRTRAMGRTMYRQKYNIKTKGATKERC